VHHPSGGLSSMFSAEEMRCREAQKTQNGGLAESAGSFLRPLRLCVSFRGAVQQASGAVLSASASSAA
jgi:hypothetical protein